MNNKQKEAFREILKAFLLIVTLCLLGWFLSGCVDDEDEQVAVDKVLLVYLGGDNNLSGEAETKLDALARGYKGAACRKILVYKDTQGKAPSLLEISDHNVTEALETYENENSADPKVFRRFLQQAVERYPKADFNLLIFSHASGWMPEKSFSTPSVRSMVEDQGREMELSDFAEAIPNKMFQTIIFEACHMAGIEVAYELKDKAKYIIASSAEVVSPGFTDVYETSVNELVYGNPQQFIETAYSWYMNQTGEWRSATFSVIETSKLAALADFVRANCDFNIPITVSDIQHFDRRFGYLFADFEDYHSRLLATEQQQKELNALIADCVIWKAATPSFMPGNNGFVIHKHSGLTAYISQPRYANLNAAYTALNWYKITHPQK